MGYGEEEDVGEGDEDKVWGGGCREGLKMVLECGGGDKDGGWRGDKDRMWE